VEALRAEVDGFVAQRDDLLLLAPCTDADAAIVAKVVRDAEDANASDLFLAFTDDFAEPGAYVSVLAERLREEHRLACEALRDEGRAPLPEVPPLLFDAARPAAARLYAGITFARSLLPRDGGHRLVWALLPQHIADRRAWHELLGVFAPHQGVQPWMWGLRLVCRDEPDTAAFAPALAGMPRVRTARVDFGPDALAASLAEEADDDTLPPEAHAQSLLMLAMLDHAHGRADAARARFTALLGHYQQTGNLAMQALVLSALGDAARRAGELDAAQHWYECAVTPAAGSRDAVSLAAVTRDLGTLALERGRFAEAAGYFEQVDRLAGHMLSPHLKIEALQQLGASHEALGRPDLAVRSWESAATLGRAMGDLPGLQQVTLARLAGAYARLGRERQRAAAQAELAELATEGT
jgi:hypothetical protein